MLPHRTTARKVFAITAGVVFGLTAAGIAVATRNSGGTYSLPAGNPVVTGTPITITWANTTLSDLGTEMTNSLSRDGYGGMRAALKGTDGTVAAPAFSFTNEAGTGIYRIGASNPGLSVAGTKRQEWNTTGTVVNGTMTTADGSVSAPAHSFSSETGTGLYRIGASDLGVSIAGTKRLELTATGLTVPNALAVTGATTLTGGVSGDTTFTGNLEVRGTTGVTLTQGDAVLTRPATQSITKSLGALHLGTSDANDVVIERGGSAALTFATGGPAFAGKPTATATVSGDGSTTLATKGYVEGMTDGYAGDAWASGGSWTTNWSNDGSNVTRIWKTANGVVHMYVEAGLSTGTTGTAFTLPTGYRPASKKGGVAFKLSDGTCIGIEISSAGVVSSPANFSATTYEFVATFTTN